LIPPYIGINPCRIGSRGKRKEKKREGNVYFSSFQWILIGEFIGTTSLGKASALLSSIPRLYNSPRGERKKPKYMSLFFL
jgi:hypothetical protein